MELTGKSVFGGIAIGRISVYQKKESVVKRTKIDDVDAEIARFDAARVKAQDQLKGLYEKAKQEVGEAEAAVFEVHQMFLMTLIILSPSRISSRTKTSTLSSLLPRPVTTSQRCLQIWMMNTCRDVQPTCLTFPTV
jgi:phosphoenolpyruvate-protein kinase (PTS system EI component)